MTFTERVIELTESNGITINKMLVDLNLAKGSFGNWQKRGTIPSGETLSKIANYFDVSVEYLLGKTEQKNKPSAQGEELTADEIEFMKLVDRLTDDQRLVLLRHAQFLLSEQDTEQKK